MPRVFDFDKSVRVIVSGAGQSGGVVLKTYSTEGIAPAARLRFWNDVHNSLGAPLEITARDRDDFVATASVAELGPLRIARVDSAAATVAHETRHLAQTRDQRFRVVLAARGKLNLRHAGQDAMLEEGDFALLDDSAPYRLDFDRPTRSLCVAVLPSTMNAYLPTPTRMCGLRMSAGRPLNNAAGTMLLALWSEIENEQLPPEQGPALARSFLQVLAATYAVDHPYAVERSVITAARRTEIKQYIETHLRSPNLTPTTIAAAFRLSRRYVRSLFADDNESVTAYLRRRRLEECACELVQPRWLARSITATAADWGFRSVTHFARAFKTAYGATPSEYRLARRGGAAD